MICGLCDEPLIAVGAVCGSCGYASTEDHTHALPIGMLVRNRYRIESVLGIGGFGVTYKALDVTTNSPVAVKELVPPGTRRDGSGRLEATRTGSGDDVVRHFLQEAEVLRRVQHPNIVQIFDFFGEGSTAFLVMEYLHGETVEMNVFSHGRWDEASTIALVQGVGSALQAVHALNFLHRDVKPANVMLVSGRGPVLIDFGSSREAVTTQNAALTQIVTPGYAAPEQYGSRGRVGSYTDIYALGSIVYFVLMGEAPPPATDRLAHDEMTRLAVRYPTLVSTIGGAADVALRLRADDRQQTVLEFFEVAGMGDGSINPALQVEVPVDPASSPSANASSSTGPATSTQSPRPPLSPPTSLTVDSSAGPSFPQSLASTKSAVRDPAEPRSRRRAGRRRLGVVVAAGTALSLVAAAGIVGTRRTAGSTTQKAKTTVTESKRATAVATKGDAVAANAKSTVTRAATTRPIAKQPTTSFPDLIAVPVPSAVPIANEAVPLAFRVPSGRSDAFVGVVYRSNTVATMSHSEALKLVVEQRQAVTDGPDVRTCDLRIELATNCIADWLEKPGLVGVIGMTKNDDVDAMSELSQSGVPMLAIGPQRESLTTNRVSPTFFRLTPSVSQIGERAAEAANIENSTKAFIFDGLAPKTTEGDKDLRAVYEPALNAFESTFAFGTVRSSTIADPSGFDVVITFGMSEDEISAVIKSLGTSWKGSVYMAGVDLAEIKGCGSLTRCHSVDSGVGSIPSTITAGRSRKLVPGSWAATGADAYDMLVEYLPAVWPTNTEQVHTAIVNQLNAKIYDGSVGRYSFDRTGANSTASAIVLRRRSTGATCIVTATGCV